MWYDTMRCDLSIILLQYMCVVCVLWVFANQHAQVKYWMPTIFRWKIFVYGAENEITSTQ